eukprot:CAMPEP_0118654438 /NCGR_PEP_ID=MMETSP0785-20121206/12397_1 /TAXON_ID=91992 /ORGANISM="Bolidomonas pacifica, Strain CCMP 1866" /LENGTH=109 /DNA_ID=CAMNT_0006547113 /DNA_START=31 /DNA_END=360 /DNA_ORIENTATION=-
MPWSARTLKRTWRSLEDAGGKRDMENGSSIPHQQCMKVVASMPKEASSRVREKSIDNEGGLGGGGVAEGWTEVETSGEVWESFSIVCSAIWVPTSPIVNIPAAVISLTL